MKRPSFVLILLLVNLANAEEITNVKNRELSNVLANFQVLAEVGLKESIISVQVIKVMDHGECDGSPQTCPQSVIYVTASETGEYPEQKTFKLPKKHGWEFVEWVKFTEYEGPENYVELKLKAQIPNVDITDSWWEDEYYLVKVNYHNAQWEKL